MPSNMPWESTHSPKVMFPKHFFISIWGCNPQSLSCSTVLWRLFLIQHCGLCHLFITDSPLFYYVQENISDIIEIFVTAAFICMFFKKSWNWDYFNIMVCSLGNVSTSFICPVMFVFFLSTLILQSSFIIFCFKFGIVLQLKLNTDSVQILIIWICC